MKRSFYLIFSIHSVILGMQSSPALTTKAQEIYQATYFGKLPADIKNLFAQFLVFAGRESNEEFLERTKSNPRGLEKWVEQLTKEGLKNPELVGCSPDCSKVIFAVPRPKKEAPNEVENIVVTFDASTKKRTGFIFDEHISFLRLLTIANDGKTFALIKFIQLIEYRGIIERIVPPITKLMVSNLQTDQCKDFLVAKNGRGLAIINICQFNKQGTKVIVRGTEFDGQDRHYIFDLIDEKEHEEKSKKNLDDYFNHL